MLKFLFLFVCFVVGGPSDTTKWRHRRRNRGLHVERFMIENPGKKLSVTFDEGKTYKVISDTYANFNNHFGSTTPTIGFAAQELTRSGLA